MWICLCNGTVYDGTFSNGLYHGEGNENYFKGNWANGNKHTLEQTDDKDYRGYGEFVLHGNNNPKLDGDRIYYKQKWDNGKLIKEIKDR